MSVYGAGGTFTESTDYVGGFEYCRQGTAPRALSHFAFSEGRVVNGEFHYDMKDHLGNVRLTFRKNAANNPEIVQEDFYYPFGLRVPLTTGDNKYLYNGKELVDNHGLQWYHYGVRYYDPQLARWIEMDPADEFQSPYSYVGNNPVKLVDPDGAQATNAAYDPNMDYLTLREHFGDEQASTMMDQRDRIGVVGSVFSLGTIAAVGSFPQMLSLWLTQPVLGRQLVNDFVEGVAGMPTGVNLNSFLSKPFLNRGGFWELAGNTLDIQGMEKHLTGSLKLGNSQFLSKINANDLVLNAAKFADEYGLWKENRAKVLIENGPIGVLGKTGKLTSILNLYKNNNRHIHGSPGGLH
jgi:RHS repeat-associated protein